MSKSLRLLIVEDSDDDTALLVRDLQHNGYDLVFERVDTAEAMSAALESRTWDLVISDYAMPRFDGPSALKLLQKQGIDIPLIILSGTIGEELAVAAMKAGAHDYLLKGNLTRLPPAIERELREAEERRQHKQSQEQVKRQFEQLKALRAIDTAISASLDLRLTLSIVLDQVTSRLDVHAADILLFDAPNQTLIYSVGRGFRTDAITHSHVHMGEGQAGFAALERCLTSIPDLSHPEKAFTRPQVVQEEGFISYFAVPLLAKGQVEGVLEIFHRAPLTPDTEWIEFLETLAGQAAIAIDNATLFHDLQHANAKLIAAYDATLEGWVKALDLRDKETEGHTQRVTDMTVSLAREMGFQDEELTHVRRGALLHDIGKIGVPDSILLKPGPLTDEEWTIMRQHPVYAYEWLSPITYLQPVLHIPYCHHEKWDGSGYPRGLKGEQIPPEARLFAVIDVWDALSSDRPYRSAWPPEKVHDHICSLAGVHFDPQVVEIFRHLSSLESDVDRRMLRSA